MIFWDDLVQAHAAAEKTAIELQEALRRRELEVKASLIDVLTGTDGQNDALLAGALVGDAMLADLVARHAEARNAQIDTRSDLDAASLRLNERLVEAHEANMKIAERIHGT